jgi:regulator of replication initiation timing
MKKIKPQTQKAKLEFIEQKIKDLINENQELKQENSKLKAKLNLS